MLTTRALFAGPGARRALVDDRIGTVEIVLGRAAYVRLEHDWLLLAEPRVQFGPLSLSVYGLGELGLAPGLPARVDGRRLELGRAGVSLERVRLRSCQPQLVNAAERSVAAAAAAAGSELPAAPASLAGGIAALARGHVSAASAQLGGRGPGLTPAGDDVLAGYAATRFVLDRRPAAVGRLSRRAEGRSSALGLAYLRCAEGGELPEPGARLLGAICAGSVEEVGLACTGLRSWGASSGAALGWGITAAVTQGFTHVH